MKIERLRLLTWKFVGDYSHLKGQLVHIREVWRDGHGAAKWSWKYSICLVSNPEFGCFANDKDLELDVDASE